jgi:hypothetical protein
MQTDERIDIPTEIRVANGCRRANNETLLLQTSAQFCNPWILLLTFLEIFRLVYIANLTSYTTT